MPVEAAALRAALQSSGTHASQLLADVLCGDDEQPISKHDVQELLWYSLPAKVIAPLREHRAIAAELARALDQVGAPAYAELCRSSTTDEVLAAYAADRDHGFELYLRASAAAGLEPVDVPELQWSTYYGDAELRARWEVSVALEESPGERPETVVRKALLRGDLLDRVEAERAEAWVGRGARRELLAPLLPLMPAAAPADVEHHLRPVLRLLAGADLTTTHRLSTSVIRELATELGWQAWGSQRMSEDDVPDAADLREWLFEAALVRRRGARLLATPAGRAVAADPSGSWPRVLAAVLPDDRFDQAMGELALAVALTRPGVDTADLVTALVPLAAESGWSASGRPVEEADVSWAVTRTYSRLRLLRLLADPAHPTWALTETGAASVRALLHARSIGPVHAL